MKFFHTHSKELWYSLICAIILYGILALAYPISIVCPPIDGLLCIVYGWIVFAVIISVFFALSFGVILLIHSRKLKSKSGKSRRSK